GRSAARRVYARRVYARPSLSARFNSNGRHARHPACRPGDRAGEAQHSPPKERDKSTPFKLSEMIDLAVKMAEADARLMLARKARQVAELDRDREKIVHLLKERGWHLAARQVQPGNA